LSEKGAAFTEHNASIEPSARQEMLARSNGRTTFPQVFIGNTHVGGCDDLYALENQGRLDGLLKTGELA
jgi:glutaredoxin 3